MRVPTGSRKLPDYSELLIHPGVFANGSGKSGRWLWLLVLHASLVLMVACAGGESSSPPPLTATPFTLTRPLAAAVRKAGIEDRVRFHDYRHTFCTNIANSRKVTLKQSMQLAGHRTAKTHLRYQHPDESGMAEAVESLTKTGA